MLEHPFAHGLHAFRSNVFVAISESVRVHLGKHFIHVSLDEFDLFLRVIDGSLQTLDQIGSHGLLLQFVIHLILLQVASFLQVVHHRYQTRDDLQSHQRRRHAQRARFARRARGDNLGEGRKQRAVVQFFTLARVANALVDEFQKVFPKPFEILRPFREGIFAEEISRRHVVDDAIHDRQAIASLQLHRGNPRRAPSRLTQQRINLRHRRDLARVVSRAPVVREQHRRRVFSSQQIKHVPRPLSRRRVFLRVHPILLRVHRVRPDILQRLRRIRRLLLSLPTPRLDFLRRRARVGVLLVSASSRRRRLGRRLGRHRRLRALPTTRRHRTRPLDFFETSIHASSALFRRRVDG